MHILFFAVRQHHLRYFSKLAAQSSSDTQEVIRHKAARRPDFKRIPSTANNQIQDAVTLKMKERQQAKGNYRLSIAVRLGLLAFYTIWGHWLYRCYRRLLRTKKANCVVLWNGLMWHQQLCRAAAQELGIQCLFMENGPLPDTTVIDKLGVNYMNSVPRDGAFYKNLDRPNDLALPTKLVARQTHHRKAKAKSKTPEQSLPGKYIFVPFQVDMDRQVICYSPWITNMPALYRVLVQASTCLPEDYVFVVKEHPSCKKEFSRFHQQHERIIFANNENTQSLIENAHAVLTINSSVGLESLLLNKYVITVGQAFYNIPGIVEMAENISELCQMMKRISATNETSSLTQSFLYYLYHQYLIEGDWREASEHHLNKAAHRIQELLHG